MSAFQTGLSRKEAAAHLRTLGYPVAARTLERLAMKGRGPPYRRFGWRSVSYDRIALEGWAQSQVRIYKGKPEFNG